MHWSRLVDAPILAIYWVSSTVLPSEAALGTTAFIWPVLLAGLTLWAFTVTGGALGGRAGAVSAVVLGVFALKSSAKYDQYAFDHHGLQILLFVSAVSFFVLREDRPRAGLWIGVCLALSVSIGSESLAQIALIGIFVAFDWILSGNDGRRRTMEFCAAIFATLVLTILATTSRESFFYPGCDALTFSVALPAGMAALGLFGAAFLASGWSSRGRVGCFLVIGAIVLGIAHAYAPYCLENPIDQLPAAIREFWLSQITEAQNVTLVIQRHTGETVALIGTAVFTILAASVFIYATDKKMEYLLLLLLVAIGLVLFLYQSRMKTFLSFSMVAVQAQVLRVIYHNYRASGKRLIGVLMILFIAFVSPTTGATIEKQYKALTAAKSENTADATREPRRIVSCNSKYSFEQLRSIEPGMVVIGFDYASYLLRYTDHSALAGNYHRNEAGILAQIDLFRSDASTIGPRLAELGVDYIAICKFNPRSDYWSSVSDSVGLPAALISGELPEYLEELEGDKDAAFHIYRVKEG
jgi:asparagine N-glycosylation enzyme membrane subunit Stt3